MVKKLKFFYFLSLSKIDREKVFPYVLDKKEAFKDYKKQLFMKYAKELVLRLNQKFEISSTLFLCKIDQEKVSGNVSIILCNPLSPPVTPCNPL